MSKVLLFSDLHAHSWREFSELVDFEGRRINSRLHDAVEVIRAVKRAAQEHGVEEAIFAGDLFHRRKLIDVTVFNVIVEEIQALAQICRVTMLVGNHDLAQKSGDGMFAPEHSLCSFGHNDGVSVIDSPRVGPGRIGYVPFAGDRETFVGGLRGVLASNPGMIVTHMGIAGARTGSVEYQPFEELTTDDLPHLPIYSGHYHRPQTLQFEGGFVRYIGAPYEMARGDGHDPRGFLILDTDSPAVAELVQYRGPKFKSVRSSKLDGPLKVKRSFVDLLIESADLDVPGAIRRLKEVGALMVNSVPALKPETAEARLKVKAGKGKLPSIRELCELYVEQNDTNLDKAKLISLARGALSSAESEKENGDS